MYTCIRMATCEIWPTPQSEQETETLGEPSHHMIAARKPQGPPQHNLKTQKDLLWELPGGLWELLGHLHIYRIYIHTYIYSTQNIYMGLQSGMSQKCDRGLNFEASQKLNKGTTPIQHRLRSIYRCCNNHWICQNSHHSRARALVLKIAKIDQLGLKTATRILCDRGHSK